MSSAVPQTNLPLRERTSFVGRTAELRGLAGLLDGGAGLVVLLGPPGVGKTRLAQRFGSTWLAEHRPAGGVWFCDLTDARTSEDVLSAVANVVDPAGRLRADEQQIGDALAARARTLLVLDNFEGVARRAGDILGRWIEIAPELTIVVTTRERLHVEGETAVVIEPMPDRDALELLRDRARATGRATALERDAAVLLEIVRRLDNLPLAIELAAARLRMLSPEQILERMPDRLQWLERAASPRLPERQRALRSAIDASWDTLSGPAQAALAQAGVFRGGFALDAAERVLSTGDALDVLHELEDKSLLVAYEPADLPGVARLGFYESIRQYACERLEASGLEADASLRHAAHYLEKGEAWIAEIDGPDASSCRAQLVLEHANLSAVRERFHAKRPELSARAGLVLVRAAMRSRLPFAGYHELLDATVAAAERTGDVSLCARAHLARGQARVVHGWVVGTEEDLDAAERYAALCAAPDLEAAALRVRASLCSGAGQSSRARAYFERALTVARRIGSMRLEADILVGLGGVSSDDGDADGALALTERALSIDRALGDRRREGLTLVVLAGQLVDAGRLDEAAQRIEHAEEPLRVAGDRLWIGIGLNVLACIAHERGELDRARSLYEQALAIHREVGNQRRECLCLGELALLACEERKLQDANELGLDALTVARAPVEGRVQAMVWWRRAAVEALSGRVVDARASLERARAHMSAESGAHATAIGLVEALATVAAARAGDTPEHERDASLEAARQIAAHADASSSAECRLLVRLLVREAGEPTRAPDPIALTLELGADMKWLRVGEADPVDLKRRNVMRRIVRALVLAHESASGEPVSASALVEEGWPGESIDQVAANNRLWFVVSSLRKLGLRDIIRTHASGYSIDPGVKVRRG